MSVFRFPRRPKKAICVRPAPGPEGGWIARFKGDEFTRPFELIAPTKWQLVSEVKWSKRRCGLPIVDLTDSVQRSAWRLQYDDGARPEEPTDRQRYARAVTQQMVRDDRRWVPCESEDGPHAA
jgi:hypothetical protein